MSTDFKTRCLIPPGCWGWRLVQSDKHGRPNFPLLTIPPFPSAHINPAPGLIKTIFMFLPPIFEVIVILSVFYFIHTKYHIICVRAFATGDKERWWKT